MSNWIAAAKHLEAAGWVHIGGVFWEDPLQKPGESCVEIDRAWDAQHERERERERIAKRADELADAMFAAVSAHVEEPTGEVARRVLRKFAEKLRRKGDGK